MEQLTLEKTVKYLAEENVEKPWLKYFGDLDYDPCASIKRPENISDEIFYKVCYMAAQGESWFDEPDKQQLSDAWTTIYTLNATGRHGEGIFDLA